MLSPRLLASSRSRSRHIPRSQTHGHCPDNPRSDLHALGSCQHSAGQLTLHPKCSRIHQAVKPNALASRPEPWALNAKHRPQTLVDRDFLPCVFPWQNQYIDNMPRDEKLRRYREMRDTEKLESLAGNYTDQRTGNHFAPACPTQSMKKSNTGGGGRRCRAHTHLVTGGGGQAMPCVYTHCPAC